MRDVAKHTGLSVSTVSHVINKSRFVANDTTKRVLEAIRELGYSPNLVARGLKGKGTRTIGVIIPDVRQVFFAETIRAIESRATELGFNVILCDVEDSVDEEVVYTNTLLSKGVDGLIIAPVDVERSQALVRGLDVPCVQIDRRVQDSNADFVGIDNAAAAEQATDYLIEHGRENVAFLGYNVSVYSMRERFKGYRSSVARHGLPEEALLISDYANGDMRFEVDEWLTEHREVDAVLSGNDDICFAVTWHLRMNKTTAARNLKVITFDFNRWHMVLPFPIGTIRQPAEEIGRKAIDLLVARCSGTAPQQKQSIVCSTESAYRVDHFEAAEEV